MFILVHGKIADSNYIVPVDNIGQVEPNEEGSFLAYKQPIERAKTKNFGLYVKETPEEIHELIRKEHVKSKVDAAIFNMGSAPVVGGGEG